MNWLISIAWVSRQDSFTATAYHGRQPIIPFLGIEMKSFEAFCSDCADDRQVFPLLLTSAPAFGPESVRAL